MRSTGPPALGRIVALYALVLICAVNMWSPRDLYSDRQAIIGCLEVSPTSWKSIDAAPLEISAAALEQEPWPPGDRYPEALMPLHPRHALVIRWRDPGWRYGPSHRRQTG